MPHQRAPRSRGSRAPAALVLAALLPLALTTLPSTAAAGPPQGGAAAVLGRMSLAQRVGQLFMVGAAATGAGASSLATIRYYHVGNVILTGRSSRGTALTKGVSDALQAQVTAATTYGVPLLVATDQEGGQVQALSGPGFSTIPSALVQGGWSTALLRSAARTWGRQLAAAGVDVDLAPVVDTVPSAAAARSNPPIGWYDREFGYTPATVASHGTAFAQGLADAGLAATAKHFPGLGRVTSNPDTASGVTDRVTVRYDPYLTPFAAAINSGAQLVMVSTAVYSRIDASRPAAFSGTVIRTLLRGDLRFTRVVVSDDLGNAKQVSAWTPAQRAVIFLQAGGDLVLTVSPAILPQMYDAVLARAKADATFRSYVNAAALRVLTAKQHQGLIPSP